MNLEEALSKFTVDDLRECYVLYDTYWDEGLNDERTLENIKNKLRQNNACPKCGWITEVTDGISKENES